LAVGIMMLPAIAARFWTTDLTRMIAIAVGVAFISGYGGLLLSYHLGAPSGPAIILVAGFAYVGSLVLGPVGGLRRRFAPGRHLEA
jgi:zinc/manganese transport system permease protein